MTSGLEETARSVCIVGGCSHVGLPLGIALSLAGIPVTLYDRDRERVAAVASGHVGYLERGADEALARALASRRLRATAEPVLTLECRRVLCTDPWIQDPSFVPLETALAEADILFVGACHDAYRGIRTDKPVVDVFRFLGTGA